MPRLVKVAVVWGLLAGALQGVTCLFAPFGLERIFAHLHHYYAGGISPQGDFYAGRVAPPIADALDSLIRDLTYFVRFLIVSLAATPLVLAVQTMRGKDPVACITYSVMLFGFGGFSLITLLLSLGRVTTLLSLLCYSIAGIFAWRGRHGYRKWVEQRYPTPPPAPSPNCPE
jgi:hypothetical protein